VPTHSPSYPVVNGLDIKLNPPIPRLEVSGAVPPLQNMVMVPCPFSIGMCRMRLFLAVLKSFFHSCLLYTFSCHYSPPTILPSSLTLSCHLFLGLPLGLVGYKFVYNTLLGILFSSILCTCPYQRNLCSLIVSVMVVL
jgi:hypothetical protein